MENVIAKDGTKIAYDKLGQGPAVILITGATGTRRDPHSEEFAQLLSTDLTVYNYDRRGRGDSTDTPPVSLQKEIDDIEALIEVAGGTAYLYGISSGGALALEAAVALQDKVTKLAVYEVPYDESEAGINAWHGYTKEIEEAISTGRNGDAAAAFMKFVGVPDEMVQGMKQAPFWAGMEAVAPTLLYDAAALGKDRLVPTDRLTKISAQTLVMDGGASLQIMPFMSISAEKIAKAIPNAQRQTLEGQSHDVDMKVLAPVLVAFFK